MGVLVDHPDKLSVGQTYKVKVSHTHLWLCSYVGLTGELPTFQAIDTQARYYVSPELWESSHVETLDS